MQVASQSITFLPLEAMRKIKTQRIFPVSPFAKLGLYRNPFGELTREERAELAVVDVDGIVSFLQGKFRRAVQFLGDCGYGKTTHLLAIQAAVSGAVFVYFPEKGPRPNLPQDQPAQRHPLPMLLIDEAQRMGWRRRRQMMAWSGPLAIATHADLSPQLERAGFEVLRVNVAAPKRPSELATILNRRVEASRLTSGKVKPPQIELQDAEALIAKYASNLRAIEQELFERYQHMVTESVDERLSVAD
jgi:hypothetical protein